MMNSKKAKGIATMVVILVILLTGLGITGFGLKSAIAKNGALSTQLETANARIRGYKQEMEALKVKYAKVNKVNTQITRDRERYRAMVGNLSNKLYEVSKNDVCAVQVVPDDFIDTVIAGLPSRSNSPPGDMHSKPDPREHD